MNPIEIEDDIRKLEATGLKFHGNPEPVKTEHSKSCPNCGAAMRRMSTLWSKCPKCGMRIYGGKISDVAAMHNAEASRGPKE